MQHEVAERPQENASDQNDPFAAFAVAGYGVLSAALKLSDGHFGRDAVILCLVTFAFWLVALSGWGEGTPLFVKSRKRGVAALVLVVFMLQSFASAPGIFMDQGANSELLLALELGQVLIVASYVLSVFFRLRIPKVIWAIRFPLLLALSAALGVWIIRSSPHPRIDVWELHQQGAAQLLHGEAVYGHVKVHDSFWDRDIFAYSYPPLNIVMTAAGYLAFGDTRYSQLAAILLGGLLLWKLAQREGEDRLWPELLAALLLLHPRGLFTLEQGWGEPLSLPLLGGFLLLFSRRRDSTGSLVLLGLTLGLKQYFVLYLPFALMPPGNRFRRALVAGLAAAATFVPFLLVQPRELWVDLVGHHVGNPFRADSLSFPALLASLGVHSPPLFFGFVAALAVIAVAASTVRDMPRAMLGSAFALALFFFFGRQAFCNYYYLIGATALFAVAVPNVSRSVVADRPPTMV